jgi:hypothetical protein
MVQFYLRHTGCFVMDATDQAFIAGDHQLHEGLSEGTAVRRRLIFRPYCPCSDCLLAVAGNCPTGRQDLGCRCQLCLCLVCIGHGHMEGNAVARELMACRHHRMDCRVQPGHLHRRNRVYCPSVGPMKRHRQRAASARISSARISRDRPGLTEVRRPLARRLSNWQARARRTVKGRG